MNEKQPDNQDIAVALHYDGESAPRVTAKGRGELAERILKAAEASDIPLQEDPELECVPYSQMAIAGGPGYEAGRYMAYAGGIAPDVINAANAIAVAVGGSGSPRQARAAGQR